ncbi:hypothetical protein [Anaerotruncus colihominis]|uniref:hypothetical protein n=1 Tax=Anaerotruncus colihominis TaxID=169435 RepID=UPI002431C7DC|nr:hypothetical protein [Anaerotruncus colihominis]
MKNEYLEKIFDRIQDGEEVGRSQRELAWAYKQPAYQKFGRICLDHPIYTDEDAVVIAQQLSLAGINELYITSQSSNQLDLWAAMDVFGLKLRGIGFIENADYIVDVERWGSSNLPETIVALRFSFKEEQQ